MSDKERPMSDKERPMSDKERPMSDKARPMTPEEMDRRKAIIKRIAEQTAKEWHTDKRHPDIGLDKYIHDAIYKAITEIFGETV